MFRSLRLTCTVTLLAASTLAPSLANAAVEHYRSKGNAADFYTYKVDPTGCINTETGLTVTENQVGAGPGPAEPSTGIYFYRTVYDACLDLYLMSVILSTTVPADTFHADSQLRSASFQATVLANVWVAGEGSITPEPFTFDLVWTGGPEIQQGGRTARDRNEGFLHIAHSTGTYRPATISGSITFRSDNILDTQHFQATLANHRSSETIHLQHRN
jgi:hypothetical protein